MRFQSPASAHALGFPRRTAGYFEHTVLELAALSNYLAEWLERVLVLDIRRLWENPL